MNKGFFDSKEYFMPNGIKLILVKKETDLFSINAAVKIGAVYEENGEKGISHFVEHMLFKGTENRSNEQLNDELENIGGEYNAYTDYNCTVVSISGLKEELRKAIELISDMLLNSTFPKDEIEKEREVILAEVRTSLDDIEDYSYKVAHEIAYKNSPLKYDTIGTESSILKFKRQVLFDFYKKYYVPNNCCISIVSSLDYEEVYNIIGTYFNGWVPSEVKHGDIIVEDNINIKKTSFKENIEQSSIVYIYTFHNLDKKHELALKILNHRFGESGNSILFRELREKRGGAYDVYSQLDTTSFVKSMYIYTSVSKKNINKTIKCINSCIENIINGKYLFNKDSTAIMKKVLKTSVISTIEDTTSLCNYIVHQSIDGNDIYEFIGDMERLENVKETDIYEAARAVFNKPTIHILMPKVSESIEE
jgi:predicted Zn-dependent peptidase